MNSGVRHTFYRFIDFPLSPLWHNYANGFTLYRKLSVTLPPLLSIAQCRKNQFVLQLPLVLRFFQLNKLPKQQFVL